jgi:hypothetical protein
MNTFVIPFMLFMSIFGLGFGTCCWFFKYRYITPLEWRIAQLEHRVHSPRTTPAQVQHLLPRTRYIPIEERSYIQRVED